MKPPGPFYLITDSTTLLLIYIFVHGCFEEVIFGNIFRFIKRPGWGRMFCWVIILVDSHHHIYLRIYWLCALLLHVCSILSQSLKLPLHSLLTYYHQNSPILGLLTQPYPFQYHRPLAIMDNLPLRCNIYPPPRL